MYISGRTLLVNDACAFPCPTPTWNWHAKDLRKVHTLLAGKAYISTACHCVTVMIKLCSAVFHRRSSKFTNAWACLPM